MHHWKNFHALISEPNVVLVCNHRPCKQHCQWGWKQAHVWALSTCFRSIDDAQTSVSLTHNRSPEPRGHFGLVWWRSYREQACPSRWGAQFPPRKSGDYFAEFTILKIMQTVLVFFFAQVSYRLFISYENSSIIE